MKSKLYKIIVLVFFFLAFISAGTAQTCALRIDDPSPTGTGTYWATLTLGHIYYGIPYVVGSQNFYML